jgi:predicted Zn finger-like uncharacterized protein
LNLTTRCPGCGTAFRVQPVQLSARGGKVRCGKCSHVFDGVAALVAEGQQGPQAEAEPSPQLALFEAVRKGPVGATGEAANEDATGAEFLDDAPPPPRRVGWALGAVLAFLVLAAQTVYHFRTDIAAWFPETRSYLATACAQIGCEVRLPRYGNLVRIESSELRRHASGEGIVQLDATFRNYSPVAHEYPSLILTLTDSKDDVLARRAISPQEYLQSKGADVTRLGFPGDSVIEVRILFETNEKDAFGYRLALSYL